MLDKWKIETNLLGYWEIDQLIYSFKVAQKHRKAFRNLQRALRHLGVVVHKVEVEVYCPPPKLIDPVPISTEGQAMLRGNSSLPPPFAGGEHLLLLDASFPPKYVDAVRELPHVTCVAPQEERHRTDYVRWTVHPRSAILEFFNDVGRLP